MVLNSGLSVRLQRAAFLLSLTYAVGLKPQPTLSLGPKNRGKHLCDDTGGEGRGPAGIKVG